MKHTILTLIFALSCVAQAGEGHEHQHSHEHIVIPATIAEVRSAITAKQSELAAALAERDAEKAHAATDFLAAYVKAIPGLMGSIDEMAKQRAEGMANNAAKAWGQAAHDAEHEDYLKAQHESAKASAAYKLLEARLPSS
jgi:hypothetical protein